MKPPRTGSLAWKRKIRAHGAAGFHEGRTYDQNIYGSFQPTLRLLWSEGYNEARAAALLKEGKKP